MEPAVMICGIGGVVGASGFEDPGFVLVDVETTPLLLAMAFT